MKATLPTLLLILINLPHSAIASEWQEYLTLKKDNYYLDHQEFKSISCNIEVPLISNMIEQIKKQIEPFKGKVKLTADLSKFTITYYNDGKITYSNPTFDVILKSSEEIADIDRVNNGIAMMNNGVSQQIEGTKNQINGLLDDYLSPKKELYKNILVTQKQTHTTVTYNREQSKITEKYEGNIIHTDEQGPSSVIKSEQFYIKTKNNMTIIQKGSANMTFPTMNILMDMSITYQNIEQIIFPHNINVQFEQNIQTTKQTGQWDIILNECRVEL